MRIISSIFTFCALNITIIASAQDNTHQEWQGIRASYHTINISSDNNMDVDLTGFSASYMKSYSISESAPLFIESGINLLWARYFDDKIDKSMKINTDITITYPDIDYYPGTGSITGSVNESNSYEINYKGYEDEINMLSICVPANLVYKCQLNKNTYILPYIGLNLRGNIIGKYEHTIIDKAEEYVSGTKNKTSSSFLIYKIFYAT